MARNSPARSRRRAAANPASPSCRARGRPIICPPSSPHWGPLAAKKTKVELYHDEMRKLMTAIHGREFTPQHKWTKRELKVVTPDKIIKYLNKKIYGKVDVEHDVEPPIYHRQNSVLF